MKDRGILQRLADGAGLPGEPLPGQSIVEIAGNTRLLVENHYGVKEYSRERIGVKVKFGMVVVDGQGLELTRMTREQLIISGCIHAVTLHRRGS